MGVLRCTEDRILLSFGSSEVQLGQSQPMTGIPTEVEVPKNVRDVFTNADDRYEP